jgi:hypothetical protein
MPQAETQAILSPSHSTRKPPKQSKGLPPVPQAETQATPSPSPSTRNPTQQSKGLPPMPQTETQQPHEPLEAQRVAKPGLTLALELAEIELSALPISGAKVHFMAALRIIKGINVGCRSILSWNFLHLNLSHLVRLLRIVKRLRKLNHMSRIYATTF